jgi:hypothetical protein
MLRECLDSILAQTRAVQDLVVVNDGSGDETASVVKSYGGSVRLISKDNGGKSSALNLAMRSCTSDYVWICDDDDIAASDGLEHLVAALDSNKTAGFAYGTFQIFRDDALGRHYTPPTYWMRDGEPNVHIQFLEEMFTFQYAMLVPRSLYAKVGSFREDLIRCQDHEMAIRLARNALSIYVPRVIFFQRAHFGLRGGLNNPIPIELNAQKFLEEDQKVIASIYKEYNLEEFTPTFARHWDPVRARRAALVERACVCAKNALWREAIDDFREANELSRARAAPEEIRLAEAVIRSPLPWDIVGKNPDLISGLRAIHDANKYGHHIIHAACRPIVWQARHMFWNGDIQAGVTRLRTLAGILGAQGALRRLQESLF